MDVGALRRTLFCASICAKASVDGAPWELLIQQACVALSGPTCWLGFPRMDGVQPLPAGSGCWAGGSKQDGHDICERLCRQQPAPPVPPKRLPDSAVGTLASSTFQPLILLMILLSHIYPPKTPWRQRSSDESRLIACFSSINGQGCVGAGRRSLHVSVSGWVTPLISWF